MAFLSLGQKTVTAIAQLNAEMLARDKGPEAGQRKLARWLSIPGWIAVTCDHSDEPIQRQEDYAACCCAIHNFSLYLWSEGIGLNGVPGRLPVIPDFMI